MGMIIEQRKEQIANYKMRVFFNAKTIVVVIAFNIYLFVHVQCDLHWDGALNNAKLGLSKDKLRTLDLCALQGKIYAQNQWSELARRWPKAIERRAHVNLCNSFFTNTIKMITIRRIKFIG